MSRPIQVTITDPKGLNVVKLMTVIAQHYTDRDGNHRQVGIGQGQMVDGYPEGTIYLEEPWATSSTSSPTTQG